MLNALTVSDMKMWNNTRDLKSRLILLVISTATVQLH